MDIKKSSRWPLMWRSTHETEVARLEEQHLEKIEKLLGQFKEAVDILIDNHTEVDERNLSLILELARVSGISLVEETLPSGFKILAKNSAEGVTEQFYNKRNSL